VENCQSPGGVRTTEEDAKRIRLYFQRNPKKCTVCRILQLGMPKMTIQNVLHKKLSLHALKIKIWHKIKFPVQ
jgi:hypothetical protein